MRGSQFLSFSSLASIMVLASSLSAAQVSVQGGSATGGTAVGGNATGGDTVGGSATGGNAVGGSATGGCATGGDAVGGSAVGGSSTRGAVSSGSAVSGTATATGGTATAGAVTPGTATATIGGRRISASSDSGVSIRADGEGARVELGGDVLVVEPDRILLNGQERASIPRSTDLVQIRRAGGSVTVRAGKDEVLSEQLGGR